MKHYDIIIIGSGIAGSGTAFNLSRYCPEKKVLVIDRNDPGNNAGHDIRTTFEKTVKEYDIPYVHKYKGVKSGVGTETFFHIDYPHYSVPYQRMCKTLLDRSGADFLRANARDVDGNTLVTNKGTFGFTNLIDCSGIHYFLRRKFRLKLPFKYWIGNVGVYKNTKNIPTDYLHYQFTDWAGFVEEINPYSDTVSYGEWYYVDRIDFRLIDRPRNILSDDVLEGLPLIKQTRGVIPVAPVLPIVRGPFAFVGDSFGNAESSMAFGVTVSLDSSKLLAQAIKKGDLMLYEEAWKEKYLEPYIRNLVGKYDLYSRSKVIKAIKGYPSYTEIIRELGKNKDVYINLMEDPTYSGRILSDGLFPKHQRLFLMFYYFKLKMKYALMTT